MKPHRQTKMWTLLRANASPGAIERVIRISRHTIRAYQQRFAANPANCPRLATGSDATFIQIAPPLPTALAPVVTTLCKPHRDFTEAQLSLRCNAMAICQDLVDQLGIVGHYNPVKRLCCKLHDESPIRLTACPSCRAMRLRSATVKVAPARILGGDRYRKSNLFMTKLRYPRANDSRVTRRSGQP